MQHAFGIARITYPRTVSMSVADPATSVALPARLQRLPGVVSRPVRLGQDTNDFFRSASDAAIKAAQVFTILDPNTVPAAPAQPASQFFTQPMTFPSWVLPAAGLGLGAVVLFAVMGGGRR